MSLKDFQTRFKNTMFQPVGSIKHDAASYADIFEVGGITLEDRLKVYHNNIIGSVCASVVATFPLLENLVGEDFLKAMARAFIFENPPTSGCLHLYGTGFDEFIRSYEPAIGLPYLSDVACLELAINKAYYAPDDEVLTAEDLGSLSEESLGDQILSLRYSVSLISSSYPLDDIRRFCHGNGEGTPPDMAAGHETRLMVFRPELDVVFVPLRRDEVVLLTLLEKGRSLGEALESTLENHSDFDMAIFLQKHLSLGTFQTL